eukprot:9623171-Karenia_brevis.AAC.1
MPRPPKTRSLRVSRRLIRCRTLAPPVGDSNPSSHFTNALKAIPHVGPRSCAILVLSVTHEFLSSPADL